VLAVLGLQMVRRQGMGSAPAPADRLQN
jgi:hypothetical protein